MQATDVKWHPDPGNSALCSFVFDPMYFHPSFPGQ